MVSAILTDATERNTIIATEVSCEDSSILSLGEMVHLLYPLDLYKGMTLHTFKRINELDFAKLVFFCMVAQVCPDHLADLLNTSVGTFWFLKYSLGIGALHQ